MRVEWSSWGYSILPPLKLPNHGWKVEGDEEWGHPQEPSLALLSSPKSPTGRPSAGTPSMRCWQHGRRRSHPPRGTEAATWAPLKARETWGPCFFPALHQGPPHGRLHLGSRCSSTPCPGLSASIFDVVTDHGTGEELRPTKSSKDEADGACWVACPPPSALGCIWGCFWRRKRPWGSPSPAVRTGI